MSLFKFELVKLMRNKKTWALLIMMTLSLVVVLLQLEKQQTTLTTDQFQQNDTLYNLVHHQRYTDYNEEDGSVTSENQQLIDQLTEMKQTIKEMDQQRLATNWQQELSLQIRFDQQAISFLKAGGLLANLTLEGLIKNKHEHEYLKQHDIKPTTIEAGRGGWYYVKYIADYWFSFLGISLLLLLCYDAYTVEKETRSIKFLFVQPFSKTAIFRSKVISNFIIITGLFFLLAIIMFLIGTIKYGPGSLIYPIESIKNGQVAFCTLGRYLVNGIMLQSLFSLFILVYLFILSLWRHDSFEVLGFSLVSLIVPSVIFNQVPDLAKIENLLPFQYLDVKSILITHESLAIPYTVIFLWLILGLAILRQIIRRSANEFN